MKRAQLAIVFGAITAALLSSTALAGEAKNQAPFTRIVVAAPRLALGGEPKNIAPFTLPASGLRAVPDWFERYAAAHPYGRDATGPAPATQAVSVLATGRTGFHWREALLGAAVATAACLLCIALAVSRMRRHDHAAGRDPVGA